MTTLLQIHSSLQGKDSKSSMLAANLTESLLSRNSGASHIFRDLSLEPIPHLDGDTFQTFINPSAAVTTEQKSRLDLSDTLVAELRASDITIIGVPMYNFGIPSTLKAWIDHVARAQVTFRMTESGPEGLLDSKKVYIIVTRGGHYSGTEADLQTPYLRMIFRLMGITDVEFLYAEGLAMGPQAEHAALEQADRAIQRLLNAT